LGAGRLAVIAIDLSYTAAGALTGLIVGLTGVGGGALMTPILLLVFGVNPVTAVATDLWFAAITKAFGARIHCRSGNVDWQIVRRLWWGSIPAAILLVIAITIGISVTKSAWLTKVVGVVVLVTAIGMLLAPLVLNKGRSLRLGDPERFKSAQKKLTILAGAVLGVFVSMTSIGAGALGSVMLLYLYPLRMTPHRLVATDIVHAIPLAVVAGTAYLIAGLVDLTMLASLLAGSIPAILIGSHLSARLPQNFLRVGLALVLTLCGVKALI
jgi:uncharacterized membrane protein YfcA